jgi:pyrroloquinoline-quinone synthase
LSAETTKLTGMTAFSLGGKTVLNSAAELEAALRFIGETRYHSLHPFHRLLHGGKLNKGQVQAWALNRYYYQSTIPIMPATRFAVEAYVHFVRDKSPLEAIASSLTELFAPNLHEERISGMLAHYDFVNPDIMSYFSRRLTQAPRDAGFALDYVKAHATTPEQREAVCNALIFKTNVLWVQLDALYHAYVEGHIPPGAFVPKSN